MTDPLRNNPQNHRVINIGDIFKDADAPPPIKDKNSLSNFIEEIVSESTIIINYREEIFKFHETKKFITNLLLPEVRKYSYSDLPSLPESSQSSGFNDPTKISKENRNILPINIKYFFIDAAMNPKDYKHKDLKEDKVIETFASYMDPATRSEPNKTICDEFLKNDDSHIAYIDLSSYGFKKSCYVKLLDGSTTKYMYIEIGLNDLLLKCKIDRKGNISNDNNSFVFTKNGTSIYNYDFLKDIFFKGNPEKNKFINENINNSDDNIKYTSIMLLLLKELGDTMQAIILEKILQEASKGRNDLGNYNYLGTSCLLTNDTVLATRCSMLSVPFLLKHNYILTSYQPPINDDDKNLIQIAYDRNQKLQEIDRIILNNEGVLNGLKEFFKNVFINQKIKSIKLSSQTGEFTEIKNRPETLIFIENIIRKIEKANVKLREISEIIKKTLKSVNLTLIGIAPDQEKQQYNQNLINICKAEFYIFRTYIYQLNAIKLFKRIEIDTNNESKLLLECYGSTSKTYLFKTKIPNKLFGTTSNIVDGFSLIDSDNNEIFENGFMRKLETLIKGNETKGGSSRKNNTSVTSVSSEDIYIKVYPYIYCYPWLIEYILDYINNLRIYVFLKQLIEKDEVKESLLSRIFSLENEKKYYESSLINNIYPDNKEKILKLADILSLLEKIIKNTYTKSSPLPRKSNKPISRKAKSEPKNLRILTRKIKDPTSPIYQLNYPITPTRPTRPTTPTTPQRNPSSKRAKTPEKLNASKRAKTPEKPNASKRSKKISTTTRKRERERAGTPKKK